MIQTVGKWMSKAIVSTDPDEPLITALELMAEQQIRHVLVLSEEGHVKGILSNRDVVRATLANTDGTLNLHGTRIDKIMTRSDIFTIKESETLAKAAEEFLSHRINALPVVNDDGKVVGIITSDDVLRAVFVGECGMQRPNP